MKVAVEVECIFFFCVKTTKVNLEHRTCAMCFRCYVVVHWRFNLRNKKTIMILPIVLYFFNQYKFCYLFSWRCYIFIKIMAVVLDHTARKGNWLIQINTFCLNLFFSCIASKEITPLNDLKWRTHMYILVCNGFFVVLVTGLLKYHLCYRVSFTSYCSEWLTYVISFHLNVSAGYFKR